MNNKNMSNIISTNYYLVPVHETTVKNINVSSFTFHSYELNTSNYMQVRIQVGGAPGARPPKIGKNMIFFNKIVIFHTKYPNNFRTSLRSAQFF